MEGLNVWKLTHQETLTEWMENQKLQLYQVQAQCLQKISHHHLLHQLFLLEAFVAMIAAIIGMFTWSSLCVYDLKSKFPLTLILVYLIIIDLLRFGNMQEYLIFLVPPLRVATSLRTYHGGAIKLENGKFPDLDPFLNYKRWPGQALNHFP